MMIIIPYVTQTGVNDEFSVWLELQFGGPEMDEEPFILGECIEGPWR